MKNRNRTEKKGFTLVEVMISLMVLVVLTLIFAGSVSVARKTSEVNGQYSQALSLCQHKIDQLRGVGYGRLNYDDLADPQIIDENKTTQPFSFTTVDNVSDFLESPVTRLEIYDSGTNIKTVIVTITWQNTSYETKTSKASLTAIITNVD